MKYLVISIMTMFIVIIRIADYIKERAVVKNFTYDIYIDSGEKTLLIKGFLDTGNELREPVTNLPCIIVENRYLKELNIKDEDKFLINYKTITDKGSIKGFKGKNIRIRNCESEHWINVEAIICECDSELSKENDFQALLSRGVI
jgi:stage II sporulation protein GA (sporulation sigma-E factor processing peptidase)